MPKGFKIINLPENVFFDSALIAGVAYDDEEDFDIEFYEQEKIQIIPKVMINIKTYAT